MIHNQPWSVIDFYVVAAPAFHRPGLRVAEQWSTRQRHPRDDHTFAMSGVERGVATDGSTGGWRGLLICTEQFNARISNICVHSET